MVIDTDGLGDMRLICGITAAEKKGKQGKEGKVRTGYEGVFGFLKCYRSHHCIVLLLDF